MLSVRDIISNSITQIRSNLPVMSCFWAMFAAGSYIFLRLNAMSQVFFSIYLATLYFFSYFFFRVYFNQRPILDWDNLGRALVKMIVIVLLAFFSVMVFKICFMLMYLFAKSLSIFPGLYNFLAYVYHSAVITFLSLICFFAISLVTVFIPTFAWLELICGKESSITFTFIELKGRYLQLLSCFLIIFIALPLFVNLLLAVLGFSIIPFIVVASAMGVFQMVAYAETYKILFAFSPFVK